MCIVSQRRRPSVVQVETRFFDGCRRQLEQLECLGQHSLFVEWCEMHPGFRNCTGLSPLLFCKLVGDIYALTPCKWLCLCCGHVISKRLFDFEVVHLIESIWTRN